MNRAENIKSIRPQLAINNKNTKPIEIFQNKTLRPILKFQNELTESILINHKNYQSQKPLNATKEEFEAFIKKYVQRNLDLKHQILGIIIGHFTLKEIAFYMNDRKEINRRIIQMQVKRFLDIF